ncbi:MAG: DsbA family protein [Marivibrio sp.]|uniref:DsbA family protein n=1 Tax=Marivibrio sp. TaxID=2039719 RepID=UPI0032EC3D8D
MTEISALTRRRFHGLALGAGAVALGAAGLVRPAYAQARSVEEMMQDRVLGDPDAPVTIYEYSSLSCPHCRAFHQDTLPRLKSAYIEAGRAKLIYRDFPLNGPAVAASMLVRCAPEDRFYPLLETLFDQQPEWSTSQDVLGALAQIGRFAGMSAGEIDACFQNEALFAALRDSRNAYADEFEISSTPTFIIGDEKIVGAQPFETFADAIEAEAT